MVKNIFRLWILEMALEMGSGTDPCQGHRNIHGDGGITFSNQLCEVSLLISSSYSDPKMKGGARSRQAGSALPAQTPMIDHSSKMGTGHEHKPPAAELNHHPTAPPGRLSEQFESTELSRHLLQLNIVISVPKAFTTCLRFRAKILPFTYKPNIIKCFTKRTEQSHRVIVGRLQ